MAPSVNPGPLPWQHRKRTRKKGEDENKKGRKGDVRVHSGRKNISNVRIFHFLRVIDDSDQDVFSEARLSRPKQDDNMAASR